MSPARPSLRRVGPWLLLAAAVLAVAVATGRRDGQGEPLDPRSTGPLGARALVLVLEELGATVRLTRGAPAPGADTAVLLSDRLDDRGRQALVEWVRAGGTLVVADPRSPLAPAQERRARPFGTAGAGERLRRECPLPALAQVEAVEPGDAVALSLPEGAVGCFPLDGGFFLVARSDGRGEVVAVGGAALFLNSAVGHADNAVLAVSLLAPRAGTTVSFLEPPLPGTGEKGLSELVSPRVKAALWQLMVAFAVFALWRSRRLGRPVTEPQPVDVAGSELVVAVGNLLQHARRRNQAADMLRGELRRVLTDRLGLPSDASSDVVVAAACARGGQDPASLAAALEHRPLSTDAELVELARSLDAIRQEVSHAGR